MKASGKSNQQRIEEAAVFRARILACLAKNGYMANQQICARLGCKDQELRTKLSIMMREGLAHSVRVNEGKFCNRVLYGAGPGDSSVKKEITQKVVAKWKPLTIRIDPLHAALFGPARTTT